MDITQSAEEIAGQDPKGLGPITSTRAQKATIIAQDSETVVLGGIMQDKTIESVSKTPVLGDIPILGRLFRFEEKKKAKVNLLVFLTPHVIERPEDLKRLADLKYEERQKWLAQRWDSGDERAPMNFQNRPGPLSAMMRALVREQARPENGGSGAPDERLIAPSSNP